MPARESASRMRSATTAPDFSASPGRMAERGPSTLASSSPVSVARMSLVFDPPPSTPATRSFMPSEQQLLSASSSPRPPRLLRLGQLRVRERREYSDSNRYSSPDQDVPRPRNLPEGRERFRHSREHRDELPGKDHQGHDDQADGHSQNGVSLDCPSPQPTEKETAEQRAVREGRDRQRHHNDGCSLLSIQQCRYQQDHSPDKREDPSHAERVLLCRLALRERQVDVVSSRGRE